MCSNPNKLNRGHPEYFWQSQDKFKTKESLKHVKAWLKPNLHKISKITAIKLCQHIGILICAAIGSVTNLDDLSILRLIEADKMGHVTIINRFSFWKKQLKMQGRRDDIQSLSN